MWSQHSHTHTHTHTRTHARWLAMLMVLLVYAKFESKLSMLNMLCVLYSNGAERYNIFCCLLFLFSSSLLPYIYYFFFNIFRWFNLKQHTQKSADNDIEIYSNIRINYKHVHVSMLIRLVTVWHRPNLFLHTLLCLYGYFNLGILNFYILKMIIWRCDDPCFV